ncbi:MAG: hypothetical protein JKY22_12390 [Flavobacteriaceae bacterium]|nr:hypothetical protein [Flavobacteriaceae bacterium]
MALANYPDLKSKVIAYAKRGTSLDLLIPDFVYLAEQEMYKNSSEPLQVKHQEITSTAALSITSTRIALPDGFTSSRELKLNIKNESGDLAYRTPNRMVKSDVPGKPSFFTIIGSEIEFDRIPDIAYTVEMQYFAEIAPLTVSNPTNSIMTNYPNIYLYGTLAQAMIFAEDIDRENSYTQKFFNAIMGANLADKRGRFGPSPTMAVFGPTP